jgi:DNA-binding NarL/FixJ family response regulator
MPGHRPNGLIVVGTRDRHWYQQDEIDYLAALAIALTGLLLGLNGPLGRLSRRELKIARLLAEGMSIAEVGAALELSEDDARRLVGHVLRKLALRSPTQLTQAWPRLSLA